MNSLDLTTAPLECDRSTDDFQEISRLCRESSELGNCRQSTTGDKLLVQYFGTRITLMLELVKSGPQQVF